MLFRSGPGGGPGGSAQAALTQAVAAQLAQAVPASQANLEQRINGLEQLAAQRSAAEARASRAANALRGVEDRLRDVTDRLDVRGMAGDAALESERSALLQNRADIQLQAAQAQSALNATRVQLAQQADAAYAALGQRAALDSMALRGPALSPLPVLPSMAAPALVAPAIAPAAFLGSTPPVVRVPTPVPTPMPVPLATPGQIGRAHV